jgi:hypothetical protein
MKYGGGSAFSFKTLKLRFSSWDMASSRTDGWAEAMEAATTRNVRRSETKRIKYLG